MLDWIRRIDPRFLLKNKENIIFLAVMSAAVLISLQIYKYQCARTEAMREETARQEERIAVGGEVEKLSKEISQKAAAYIREREAWDESFLRKQASSYGLKIVSFSQEAGKQGDFTEEDLFNLELKGGYHSLAKFISYLESRPQLLRIEGLSLKSPVEAESEDEDLSLILSGGVTYIKAR